MHYKVNSKHNPVSGDKILHCIVGEFNERTMKDFFILNIVFLCLSNSVYIIQHAQCSYFQDNNSANPVRNLGLTYFVHAHNPALQHRPVKRQSMDQMNTLSPDDEAFCHSQVDSAACSTGIRVGFIEASLSCGRADTSPEGIEEAQRNANECAMNEGGKLCSSALTEFELVGAGIESIDNTCSEVLTNDSCPSSCCTLLEAFKSSLGCCINAYINGSYPQYSDVVLNYHVWNLCSVPLPAADCANGPAISRPKNVQNCTEEEYYDRLYTLNACLPQRGQISTH